MGSGRSYSRYSQPCLMVLFIGLCIVAHEYFASHLQAQVDLPEHAEKSKSLKVAKKIAQKLPFPTDPKKPVLYMIQMEGNTPAPSVNGADFICLSWKLEIKPCFFKPESSWTQGRNFLWKKACTMKKKYMYYVFMDEDIGVSNFTLFEDYLVKFQPPVGVPAGIAQLYAGQDKGGQEALRLHSFDAAFNAFHYDVVHESMVLPYIDLFDKFSWWSSQLFMIYLCQIFYDNEVVGFMRVLTSNSQHRAYPRGWNMSAMDSFFKDHIIADSRLRVSWKGYSWTTTGSAFKKIGKQRYFIPEDFLTLADSESPFWKRINQIKASEDGCPPMVPHGYEVQGKDMSREMFGLGPK